MSYSTSYQRGPHYSLSVFVNLSTRNEKLLADPTRLRQISERIPAGRWGQPQDFAGPVVFLASNASQYVCGELLVVDGVSLLHQLYWLLSIFAMRCGVGRSLMVSDFSVPSRFAF